MKNTKKLIASVLASLLILSNTPLLPAYAATNENVEVKSNSFTIDGESLIINKKNVKPGDLINVSLKVNGDISNIKTIFLSYSSEFNKGAGVKLNYNPETNLFSGTLEIDKYMAGGKWSVSNISIEDKDSGLSQNYSENLDTSKIDFNVDNANSDITGPVLDLDSIKIDKKDVKNGDTVNISFKAYDDNSGISKVELCYVDSTHSNYELTDLNFNTETGLYEGKIDINDSMETSTWQLYRIDLYDNVYNYSCYLSSKYDFSNAAFNVTKVEPIMPTIDTSTLKIDKKDVVPNDLIYLTVRPSENITNIHDMSIIYQSPITSNENWVSFNYNSETNMFEGYMNITDYMEYGLWTIKKIQICDNDYNYYYMTNTDYDFSNADFNVTNDNADFTAPSIDLNSLRISKKSVQAGDTISASVEAKDDNSGISSLRLFYKSPTTSEEKEIYLQYNLRSGLYEGDLTIDEDMEAGDWELNSISISDNAANFKSMNSSDYNLSNGNFNVNNTKDKTEDVTAPTLDISSLKIDKNEVKPNDNVIVSIKAEDDNSGINYIYLSYKAPVTNEIKSSYLYYNAETKLYEGTLNINDYMENGTWTIDSIELSDIARNTVTLKASDYDYSNADFNVSGSTNLDITPPTFDLSSLKVDKKNVSLNDTVTVSLKATDDKSGIPSITMSYKSQLKDTEKYLTLEYNAETDFYEATIDIDSSMAHGLWTISTISAFDNSLNYLYLPFYDGYDFSNADFTVNND